MAVAAAEIRSAAPLRVVSLAAVAANTRLLAERAQGQLMAVVKADGYGHGAVDVARTALANGATSLGVTSIEEALQLRASETSGRTPILSWLNPVDADWARAVTNGVDIGVPSLEHLDAFTQAARRLRVRGHALVPRVHLQLDTGMSRDGCPPEEWADLCRLARAAEESRLLTVAGVMGHLGCSATPSDAANEKAREGFGRGVEVARAAGLRPRLRHLAATAATLTDPAAHFELCRVGAGLVGIDPSETTVLRGAMTLGAPLSQVREVPAGSLVGYGRGHVTGQPTRLGLLPLGYADGIPRSASGQAQVSVRGTRCPLLGAVSMDQSVVGLDAVHARPGDRVTVFGPGDDGEPTVAEWAAWAGTIPHEIVTRLGQRTRRVVLPTEFEVRRDDDR
jgi:alanine racemase